MAPSEHKLNASAEIYWDMHRNDAYRKVGEDISMAVGNQQWDYAYFLQQVQSRVRKLERIRQIATELRDEDCAPAKGTEGDGAGGRARTDIISLEGRGSSFGR
jgi:hypothetical protein